MDYECPAFMFLKHRFFQGKKIVANVIAKVYLTNDDIVISKIDL